MFLLVVNFIKFFSLFNLCGSGLDSEFWFRIRYMSDVYLLMFVGICLLSLLFWSVRYCIFFMLYSLVGMVLENWLKLRRSLLKKGFVRVRFFSYLGMELVILLWEKFIWLSFCNKVSF